MDVNSAFYWLVPAFGIVAFVYASVGFGGGSSYLALLTLAGLPFPEIRFVALCCNVAVVSGSTLLLWSNKQIEWLHLIPLVAAGVPMAFLGALAPLHEKVFFILLGISLIAAAMLLWLPQTNKPDAEAASPRPYRDGLLGAALGFLSGLVGIGGGIFLSPALHFLRWGNARKITTATTVFILFNSIAGIAGQWSAGARPIDPLFTLLLCGTVIAGGQLGLRYSLHYFKAPQIRKTTAILIFLAGCEVLWKHL